MLHAQYNGANFADMHCATRLDFFGRTDEFSPYSYFVCTYFHYPITCIVNVIQLRSVYTHSLLLFNFFFPQKPMSICVWYFFYSSNVLVQGLRNVHARRYFAFSPENRRNNTTIIVSVIILVKY